MTTTRHAVELPESLGADASLTAQGNWAFLRGRYSDAIKLYTRALDALGPASVSAGSAAQVPLLLNRAAASLQLELHKHCLKDVDTVIAVLQQLRQPSSARAAALRGRALVGLGRRDEGVATWRAALQSLDGDVAELEQLLSLLAPPSSPTVSPVATTTTARSAASAAAPSSPTLSLSAAASAAHASSGAGGALVPSASSNGPQSAVSGKLSALLSGSGEEVRVASHQVAARGLVQHGVGQIAVDEKIAFGYLQVNTGNLAGGIRLFGDLLREHPNVIAAYLGRGTAHALSGQLDDAIRDFGSAISLDSRCLEAWKRRGQTRAARGADPDALSDLTFALKLAPTDTEVLHQRGLVHYKLRNYRRALTDFESAASIASSSSTSAGGAASPGGMAAAANSDASQQQQHLKLSLNHAGLCLNTLGRPTEAIDRHRRALALDGRFREAWANIGQAYKELGQFAEADAGFGRALALDSSYIQALHLRGLTRHGAGLHRRALVDLRRAVSLEPANRDCRHMAGVVLHGLGALRAAIAEYTELLRSKADHVAWYLRELALYWHHRFDRPFVEFNADGELHAGFKEGECKRSAPALLEAYTPQPPLDPAISDVDPSAPLAEASVELRALIDAAMRIGTRLQYRTPGFLSNRRQHATFGLAALEAAQALRRVWAAPGGGGQLVVSHASSDRSAARKPRTFGWRDVFDVAVRWRQVSEPNDPVWFVDQLSPEQFAEGFGSHTPMVTGQTTVVRYSPMAPRAVAIMKKLIVEHGGILRAEVKRAVAECASWPELHATMKRDFWCVTPCASTARPGVQLEGTRLTIQYVAPEGFEFSIRTPGTPPRWMEFDEELAHVFGLLATEASRPVGERNLDRLSELILTLVFYWYNFMPLSRGTAAVGYITMVALFLSLDVEIGAATPPSVQIDWEAILGPSPSEFIAAVSPWLYPARTSSTLMQSLPDSLAVIPNYRQMIRALNFATLADDDPAVPDAVASN